MPDPTPKRRWVCSRQVECLFEVEADNIRDALAQLPSSPDDCVEQAMGVAFGTQWSIQQDSDRSSPQVFDDDDVTEAKKRVVESLPMDD
jgi:hypothetical protein